MKKILITGFEPFGGETVNPSYEAVRRLPDMAEDAVFIKKELPVSFERSGELLRDLIHQYEPDMVLCVGQAGGCTCLRLEQIAVNCKEASIADNDGAWGRGEKIIEDGPDGYFTKLPVRQWKELLAEHNIPCQLSWSAGTYVCNCLMYMLLHEIAVSYPAMEGGFLHIPYNGAQAAGKNGVAYMPTEEVVRALNLILGGKA